MYLKNFKVENLIKANDRSEQHKVQISQERQLKVGEKYMSGKAITVNKLDKSDYYDIGLIILFSLYAYFFMGQIFTAGDADPVNGVKTLIFSFSFLVSLRIYYPFHI